MSRKRAALADIPGTLARLPKHGLMPARGTEDAQDSRTRSTVPTRHRTGKHAK